MGRENPLDEAGGFRRLLTGLEELNHLGVLGERGRVWVPRPLAQSRDNLSMGGEVITRRPTAPKQWAVCSHTNARWGN
eukprot:8107989-Heterocapsa_arctica.AAC.1